MSDEQVLDATQTGAEDAGETQNAGEQAKVAGESGQATDPRMAMMDALAANRVQDLNEELERGESNQRVPMPGDGAAPDGAGSAEPGGDQTIYDFLGERDLEKRVRAKIDGHEIEVPVREVLATFQKTQAADKRLNEASAVLENARKQAEEILATANAAAGKGGGNGGAGAPADAAAKGSPPDDIKGAIQQAVSLIYEGDQEQATEALTNALTTIIERRAGNGATLNSVEVAQEVKTQLAWEEAIGKFEESNADIAHDATLLSKWNQELHAVAGESTTPAQAAAKATERVRDWMKQHGMEADHGDQPTQDDRTLRKERDAGRHSFGSPASIPAPSAKTETTPQSATQVVAAMAATRGQRL